MRAQIDAVMQELIKPNEPGAAIAVINDGEIIHSQGYGLANLEWQIPNQPTTVFRLASVTKQFTAMAILLLQEEGKLTVNDPITKFLPTYPCSGHDLFIHHLLTHTSGIKSYTSIEGWFPNKIVHEMTPQAICDGFSQIPFDFRPGSRFLYNNSGYILLGMIIEAASGMSYAQFIQERIFQPLGMTQSYYMSNEPVIPRRAAGYAPDASGGFQNAAYLSMTQPYAAGALGSTVLDLLRWDSAIRQHQLVSAASQEAMFTPVKLADGKEEPYGFGWGLADYNGHRLAHHAGGIHGFSTFLLHFRDRPLGIAVLANRDNFDAGQCALQVARLVLGLPAIERTPITLPEEAFAPIVGDYLLEGQWPVTISRAEGGLLIKLPNGERRAFPVSATTFYLADNLEEELRFSDEIDGRYTKYTWVSPLHSLSAQRAPEKKG